MVFATSRETSDINTAVAIIGAGPAGLSLALTLARANIDTVIIESGGERADPWVTALSSAAAINPENHVQLEWASQRRIGGASCTWGGRCVDMDPIDFESRLNDEAPGWPISYEEATAEAAEAAKFLGIGKPEFEARLDDLGTESTLHTRLERWCANPRLAKRHATEIGTSKRACFYTNLTCTGILFDPGGRQTLGLRVKHRSGREYRISARHYVVAAGGIETARLLLASSQAEFAGTGFLSPWLGRGYMGHFEGAIADLVLDRLSEDALDYRLDGTECFVRSRLMLRSDAIRRNGLRNIAFIPSNPPLSDWRYRSGALSAAALALSMPIIGPRLQPGPIRNILLGEPLDAVNCCRHLMNIVGDASGAINFVMKALIQRLQRPQIPGMFVRNNERRYCLRYIAEQSPLYASRILLSRNRDALGLPRVVVEKSISSADVRSVLKAHETIDLELRRLKLGRLEYRLNPADRATVVAADESAGYHQIGLARMGNDWRSSVVDLNCTVRSVHNLHIASSAVFSTSGQANPTFLIICLALRLAKRLIADLRSPPH